MRRFLVEIPFAGYASALIEAENEGEAIGKAEKLGGMFEVMSSDADVADIEVMEWSFFREIVSGNVCRAPKNRASAEEVEE